MLLYRLSERASSVSVLFSCVHVYIHIQDVDYGVIAINCFWSSGMMRSTQAGQPRPQLGYDDGKQYIVVM